MFASPSSAASFKDENEGIARVVAVDSDSAWLEPEQTGSCSGCASASTCGTKGMGTLTNRLEFRRFAIQDQNELKVGDRVIVAFGEQALVGAAALAYVLPLWLSLTAAVIAQELAGKDSLSLLAAVFGLVVGFGVMKLVAVRLAARGVLKPRIVRRLGTGQIQQTGA